MKGLAWGRSSQPTWLVHTRMPPHFLKAWGSTKACSHRRAIDKMHAMCVLVSTYINGTQIDRDGR